MGFDRDGRSHQKTVAVTSDRQLHGAPQGGAHGTPPARRDLVGRPAGDWEDLLGTGLGASCGRIFFFCEVSIAGSGASHADELCNGKDSTRRGRPVLAIDRRIRSGGPDDRPSGRGRNACG